MHFEWEPVWTESNLHLSSIDQIILEKASSHIHNLLLGRVDDWDSSTCWQVINFLDLKVLILTGTQIYSCSLVKKSNLLFIFFSLSVNVPLVDSILGVENWVEKLRLKLRWSLLKENQMSHVHLFWLSMVAAQVSHETLKNYFEINVIIMRKCQMNRDFQYMDCLRIWHKEF